MNDIILLNCGTAHGLLSRLKAYLELCKFKIALFSSLSAVTGYVLANPNFSTEILIPFSGVLLLACGACSLNQYQERATDALMYRTKTRPIPTGRICPDDALLLSMLILTAGFVLLLAKGGFLILCLGVFAVIWYNGVYTYLKKVTVFAAIPGAITGTVPPAIGWTAGGGDIYSFNLAIICFFFFIWQIPHFWLLLMSYDGDYSKAGFPSLKKLLSSKQIERITFTWIAATAVSALFLPHCVPSPNMSVYICLICAAAWLVWNGTKLLNNKRINNSYITAFHVMNIYVFVIMLIINIDRLFFNLS